MTVEPSQLARLSAEISVLAQAAAPSTVAILDRGRTSTGFLWRPDVVATASEPLEARRDHKVAVLLAGDTQVEGTVVGHDPSTDLALIRLPAPGTQLPTTASARPLQLGEAVVAVGRGGHGTTCAVGFVALAGGPWRSRRGGEISQRVRLDLALRRQGEGSAVLDATGRLRGMAVLGPMRRVLLIPADTIERAGMELLTHGRIRRGYLGVRVQPVRLAPAATVAGGAEAEHPLGLMVMGLDREGPASKAGLVQGDIIRAVDGETPHSPRGLSRLLPSTRIGQTVAIDLVRSGTDLRLPVVVGESPVR